MSTVDTHIANFISHYCIPIIIVLCVTLFVLKNIKCVKNRVFSRYLAKFESSYGKVANKHKEKLFYPLFMLDSCDWNLRNEGSIRILELGVRTGENLQFYPNNSRVILVDKNIHIDSYFKSHPNKTSHIKVESVIVSAGDQLPSIPSDSIDAVVATLFFCSAKNIEKILKEVKRILAPAGKLFFLEHVHDRPGSVLHFVQTVLSVSGVWPLVFEGCHLNRNPSSSIKAAGFSDVSYDLITLKSESVPLLRIMKSHIVGTAMK